MTRYWYWVQMGKPEKKFKEKNGLFAVEPEFFDMFDFKWLAGSPSSSLADPNSAVLTRRLLKNISGTGKRPSAKPSNSIIISRLKVTGILENPPPNTDFQFKIVDPINYLTGSPNPPTGAVPQTVMIVI